MNPQKWISLVLALMVLSLSICFGVYQVQANSTVALDTIDQQQIKQVVNDYFVARYQSFQNLHLSDFTNLVINNSDIQKEMDKLDLTVYQHKIYQLRYQQYRIYLNFGDVLFYPGSASAKVKLMEGSDVIYENSSSDPTKMRDLEHVISLKKVNGSWKITSDLYEDDFWRMLKNTNQSMAELRSVIENSTTQNVKNIANLTQGQSVAAPNTDTCIVRGVNVCFDRAGAVSYANNHASYDSRNQDYYWFPGNDCTNFVSQALYLGGDISMFIPAEASQHLYDSDEFNGWYYFSMNGLIHRSPSWAGVTQFNSFFVPGPTEKYFHYLGGPIATSQEFNQNDPIILGDLAIGDIIQFDWVCTGDGCNPGYDHSAIVVDIQYNSNLQRYDIFVDAHTQDFLHHNIYLYPAWTKIRFIHIFDRLQQSFAFLPTIQGGNAAIPNFASSSAYPAPGQQNDYSKSSIGGYPAPGQEKITNPNQGYPAP